MQGQHHGGITFFSQGRAGLASSSLSACRSIRTASTSSFVMRGSVTSSLRLLAAATSAAVLTVMWQVLRLRRRGEGVIGDEAYTDMFAWMTARCQLHNELSPPVHIQRNWPQHDKLDISDGCSPGTLARPAPV